MSTISAERVRYLFRYDPNTGALTNRVRRSSRAPEGHLAGTLHKSGALQVNVDGKIYYQHRLIWLWMTGKWPTGQVDHEDLNKGNNAWKNLRDATQAQNMHNRPVSSRNVLGIKGVTWRPDRGGKYAAQIYIDGKNRHLGLFETIEEASAAYTVAARLHRGSFARS